MANETAVAEPVQAPVEQAPAIVAPVEQDPFALDESRLASLSPEQRASIDPIINDWRAKAKEEISKRESSVETKYKPMQEKAMALEKLTSYQPFVQWWTAQQQAAQQGATAGQSNAIQQTKPADIATSAEWQEALWEASQGDSNKLQTIQSRMMATWATPFIQNITAKQQHMETTMAVRDLFETHPDAKQLDEIGIDPKTKEGTSLLEMGLDWAERNRRPLEEGYQLAKRWADSIQMTAQQKAMGLVNSKRNEVTAGNSTTVNNTSVVEVANADELLRRSLEAQLSGNKDVRFVIKGR